MPAPSLSSYMPSYVTAEEVPLMQRFIRETQPSTDLYGEELYRVYLNWRDRQIAESAAESERLRESLQQMVEQANPQELHEPDLASPEPPAYTYEDVGEMVFPRLPPASMEAPRRIDALDVERVLGRSLNAEVVRQFADESANIASLFRPTVARNGTEFESMSFELIAGGSEDNSLENRCQFCGRSSGLKLFKVNTGLACFGCYNPVRSYNSDVIRHKNARLNNSLQLFGEELELMFGATNDGRKQEVAAALLDSVNDMGIIKHDGSIPTGFEIVSLPVPLEKVEAQWSPVFDNLNTRKIANFVASKHCGMHVHTSKRLMSSKQLRNLLVFFNKASNKGFIEMLGGRELNRYCEQVGPSGQMWIEQGEYETLENSYCHKKYLPVAVHKPTTVEFRFFKATKRKELFFANVQAVGSFVEFARLTDTRNMQYTKYTDWLLHNKNTYIDRFPHLYEVRGKELSQWS